MLADLAAGASPETGALALLQQHLRAYVARVFADADPDDVVQAVIVRLLTRSGRFDAEIENPWGYVVSATRYAALDTIRARRRRRELPLESTGEGSAPEDHVASLLDRDATHSAVVTALRALIAEGDDMTVPIITTWLDIADELGRAPSTREVAPRAGVSHTRVAQALKRFRATVADHLN